MNFGENLMPQAEFFKTRLPIWCKIKRQADGPIAKGLRCDAQMDDTFERRGGRADGRRA
jgi:hypothetical protein